MRPGGWTGNLNSGAPAFSLTDRSVGTASVIPAIKSECPAFHALLDAAMRLFAEHGYHGVSMNQVALAAGVSKANVFHHFPNKETLFLAALRNAADRRSAVLEAGLQKNGDFAEGLTAFLTAHLDSMNQEETASRLIMRAVTERDLPMSARNLAEQLFTETCERLMESLAERQRAGDWRDDLPPEFVMFLLLAGNSYLFQTRRVLRHLPGCGFADDPETFARRAADVFWNGLRPRD